ncbi:TetR/AcrR family transcriptional regulator [Chitinophaga sp. HK235]|uniref:TetR/AcrR family transcriptional regulator n=1 Tax=Chitinophaga sp. HK235 TaxID=2952571 RepID=UPI001BA692B2|nr:TetR/AcrR family transcriptional regulator [Chitinophaga sp. HK235]
MGSKERIAREKEQVRKNILDAALEIIIEEGCLALSMRKIADRIEYAAATIYEYFANKDTILAELTGQGYTLLANAVKKAGASHTAAAEKVNAMWLAYWNFAFRHKELYKLMYGIQVSCPKPEGEIRNIDLPRQLFTAAITGLIPGSAASDEAVVNKYYALWATVHGLVSINIVNEKLGKEVNHKILEHAMAAIIHAKHK